MVVPYNCRFWLCYLSFPLFYSTDHCGYVFLGSQRITIIVRCIWPWLWSVGKHSGHIMKEAPSTLQSPILWLEEPAVQICELPAHPQQNYAKKNCLSCSVGVIVKHCRRNFKMLRFVPKYSLGKSLWGSNCSTAVELTPYDREITGPNPAGCCFYSSIISLSISVGW